MLISKLLVLVLHRSYSLISMRYVGPDSRRTAFPIVFLELLEGKVGRVMKVIQTFIHQKRLKFYLYVLKLPIVSFLVYGRVFAQFIQVYF